MLIAFILTANTDVPEVFATDFIIKAACASLSPMFFPSFQQCGEKQCGKNLSYQSNSAPEPRFFALH
jgi:hypothetical protein